MLSPEKIEWLDNDVAEDDTVSYAQVVKAASDVTILREKASRLKSLYDEFTEAIDANPGDTASDVLWEHRRTIEDMAAAIEVEANELEHRFSCAPKRGFWDYTPITL